MTNDNLEKTMLFEQSMQITEQTRIFLFLHIMYAKHAQESMILLKVFQSAIKKQKVMSFRIPISVLLL